MAYNSSHTDPWVITDREKLRYQDQFNKMQPVNGMVTGEQVKGFFLQSQLPSAVLGNIWKLADTDCDGKMTLQEFLIACKLINLKLRGFEIPTTVPLSMTNSATPLSRFTTPLMSAAVSMTSLTDKSIPVSPTDPIKIQSTATNQPSIAQQIADISTAVGAFKVSDSKPASEVASPIESLTGSLPRGSARGSIVSMKSESGDISTEWSIPSQVQQKYTQLFNITDKNKTGYISGVQARSIMTQTKLSTKILAKIWSLSDMDGDGRLSCEEFILAMYLCEISSSGKTVPVKLPTDLVPPAFRRNSLRKTSVTSQGSLILDQDPAYTLLQTSFEDKRKENFEKGQAELERRRKTMQEQIRKEAEERERKEREEQEKRERAQMEAERKRQELLERQLRLDQELEQQRETERKRQQEMREAARKEMERQLQLELEKQRLLELQAQRQREQEVLLKLKARKQTLNIELSTFQDQVKELSQKICDTRIAVSAVKGTIDGMRTTRDQHMLQQTQLKQTLKEHNNRLLALAQEKVKIEGQSGGAILDNKKMKIKALREKIESLKETISSKMMDIENNNTQLEDLKTLVSNLVNECENLYLEYEQKSKEVLELKNSSRYAATGGFGSANSWNVSSWPSNTGSAAVADTSQPMQSSKAAAIANLVEYRALYSFQARNADELSFEAGDIIEVHTNHGGEPGWLAGEISGKTGWFPEAYAERISTSSVAPAPSLAENPTTTAKVSPVLSDVVGTISEPEKTEPVISTDSQRDYYIASYPYKSQEPGDLTFESGEVIEVIKKDGDWWTGQISSVTGIFPSNYVQKLDVRDKSKSDAEQKAADAIDNEVSQINEVRKVADADAMINQTPVTKVKKTEIASVIAPYQATSGEQLSLARGQLIMIRKKTDSGWWEGELQAKGKNRQVGWFPASYVKVLNSSGRTSGRTTPVSSSRIQQEVIIDKVIALFPYTAANADEISFAKDDIISVLSRDEEAWWKGELNGVTGLFPSNYVTNLVQHK